MESIESILTENLRPARAPEELWERVIEKRAPVRGRSMGWTLVVASTAVVAVIALIGSLGRPETIRSSEPAAIRAWVKSRTGMNLPLVGGELIGAEVRRGTVEVAYRVDGHEAALVVARAAAPGDPVHWVKGKNGVSWTMGGQVYTLAELDAGCRLCHAGPMFN